MATQVNALLQAITPHSLANEQIVPVSPTPAPTSLHADAAVIVISGTETDTVNLRVRYNYLAYKKYYNNSIIYLAVVEGQTNWVNISDLCPDYPNVNITSPTVATAIVGSSVQFTIDVSIGYDSSTIGPYSVTTEP